MANERQFFRDINPGDVSIEGRKSNGVTADINGNTIIYAGIKQSELQKLNQEKYLGNVPIDGYTSTFIAALAPGQLPPYPAGNNNNETYFESKTTDPNKIIVANQQITPTPTPQPTITITPTPTSLPTTETTASKPAPNEDGGFIFLDETGFAIEPVQLTEYILFDIVSPTVSIPAGLTTEPPSVRYNGPKDVTVSKGGKLVLNTGVLVGVDGDKNQEIHLPNPVPGAKPGTELPDGYRGIVPVKQETFVKDLISYTDLIAAFKRVGLTEQQARNCFSLTALEASRRFSSDGYFGGYDWNIFGLQAEGKWRQTVSQYIDFRYIAKDAYGLRIFAGFTSIDRAVASKAQAMNFKGLLDATDADAWAELYRCTWVASGCDDPASLSAAKNVYASWGVTRFNKYNKSY